MTPAIDLLQKNAIDHTVHQYEHDSGAESYGLEASEKLAVDAAVVFKTLVVQLDKKQLAVAILPVSQQLSLKAMARACKAKRAAMADPQLVQRMTGYVLGGVSPLGQKKRLKTIMDASASNCDGIFISAGKRGLEIEMSADDLLNILGGTFAGIAA